MPTSHHIPRRPIPRRRSLALLGLFTASALSAQPAPTAARVRRVADSLITRFVSTKPVPGLTVAMVRDGDTLVLGARGRANLELDVPMRTESVLRIGSITKQFTAVQVLQLVDAGRVRLDDPVGMYLPAVPGAWHAVTVRQLLNHTSGLPNYTDLGASWRRRWGEELEPDTIVALASARPADFAPGTSWRYNNTGYILLGMLVAERSGRPWAQDLEQRLTTPLALRDTRDCQNQPVLARRASGYAPKDKGYVNAPYLAMTHPYAGGAMCSTVRDLLRWQAALHGGRLLSPASYRAMTTPEGAAVARHYGFGIERDTIGGRTMLAHGGWVPGFVSYALYVPEARLSVVILTNGDASTPDDLARNLARAALGVPLAAPARPAVVAAADLTPYLGRYAVTLPGAAAPQGFEVRREGDRLVIHADGQPPAVMTPVGTHTFAPDFDQAVRVVFTLEGAQASRLTIQQGGNTFGGPRTTASAMGPAGATAATASTTTAPANPYVGRYALVDSARNDTTPLTVTLEAGVLTGQLRQNTPTRLEATGTHQFRPADAPEFSVRFDVRGDRATAAEVRGPGLTMKGLRIDARPASTAAVSAMPPARPATDDPTASGPLFEALARADSALFTAAFVSCDTTAVFRLLADSVEFYHDQTGLHVGPQVRADFRTLTGNCPARNGVRRVLLPATVHVYPIKDFGAMQSGVHRFVQEGASDVVEARFVHLWRREGDQWKATRIVSVDHRAVPRGS